MKFAIPLVQGLLCAHFGHSEKFAVIDTKDGHIKSTDLLTPPPHESGVLPRWLQELGVNVIIAGGMGRRAQDIFSQTGITVVVGAPSEEPEFLIQNYLNGTLATGVNMCDH